MSQGNFPFIAITKRPEAASALIMRNLDNEGEAVKYSIRKAHLKQSYVAACMNVSEATVSNWANGVSDIPDLRVSRFCEITGSLALKQFRDRAAKEAAAFNTETTAQKMDRLISLEAAA